MEEPKKVLKALYLGSLQVNKASGMDVLNDAIDRLVNEKPQNEWEPVNVAVAPSTITISDLEVAIFWSWELFWYRLEQILMKCFILRMTK